MNLDQFQTTDLTEIRQTIADMIAKTEQNKQTLAEIMAADFEASIMSVSMVNPALEAILEDLV